MTNIRTELSSSLDHFGNIEGDIDLVKIGLHKVEGFAQSTADSTLEDKKLIEDIDSRMRQLALSVSETNVNHMGFADRLSEVRNLHDGLNDRHMQMMASLQQLRQSDEHTRASLKRHEKTCDKQKKDAQRSFALLDDRTKTVEAMLLETTHKVQQSEKKVERSASDIKHLLAEMGEFVDVQQGMNTAPNSPAPPDRAVSKSRSGELGNENKFGTRMGRIEEQFASINTKLVFEKEAANARHKELEDKIFKAVSDTRENTMHVEHIVKTHKSDEERILRSETMVSQCESNVQRLAKMCEKCEGETRVVTVDVRDLMVKVDVEKFEREKTNLSMGSISKDLVEANAEIGGLHKESAEVQVSITKLGMRLELAHEYFQGISKGFQDTHKRVTAGLDGMVPPTTQINRKTLPEIPGSARREAKAQYPSLPSTPSPMPPSSTPSPTPYSSSPSPRH
jgi:chromosome segregation ATPase